MLVESIKYLQNKLPNIIQKQTCKIPLGIQLSASYRKTKKLLKHTQLMSKKELAQYQFTSLKETLIEAGNNVAYYSRLFKETGFNPELKDVKDIEALPLLSKETVFKNSKELKNRSFKSLNSYKAYTGGTTGCPLPIMLEIQTHFVEWAFIHTLWNRVGFRNNQKRVSFLGVPFKNNRAISFKYNFVHKELQLSPLLMEEIHLKEYVKLIKSFKPAFIYGLPSAISVFANFLNLNNIHINGIQAVLCGSENISQKQRNLISSTFNARVYSWYGQTEKVVLAGEGKKSTDYFIFPEYGYTELIDKNGNVIREPDKYGEIVGTGFINKAMPLIRYRTGDFGCYSKSGNEREDNYIRLKNEIKGRRCNGFLFCKDGKKILFSSIETQTEIFRNIYQCQFIQNEYGQVNVKVIASDYFTSQEIEIIEKKINSQVDGSLRFKVFVVEKLEQTENGKVKSLIQNLKE